MTLSVRGFIFHFLYVLFNTYFVVHNVDIVTH